MNKKKAVPEKSSGPEVSDLPDHWPQWVKDSFDELIAAEDAGEEPFLEGAPEWTDKAMTEMAFQASPTINRSPGKQTGPQILGALIGHQEWLFENDFSGIFTEEQSDHALKEFETNFRRHCQTLEPEQLTQAMKDFDQCTQESEHLAASFEKVRELKKSIIKRCLARVAEQASVQDRLEFLEAYTKARRVPVIKPPEQTSPRVKMLTTVLFGWRNVEKMKNRSVVRRFLVRLFGKPGVYNSEFVNKVCRDIKLTLAKRGAPKK